jgi:hypothetical protein
MAGRSAAARGLRRRIRAVSLIAAHLLAGLAGVAGADDAAVLPKGRFRIDVEGKFYIPYDERFDPDGKTEPLARDFNTTLDGRVFPALRLFDPVVGGRASLGDTQVSFEHHLTILDLNVAYGLTDRLTVGIRLPYYIFTNQVETRLNSGPGSSANIGLNPKARQPGQPPLIPIAAGGIPLTTEDVQQLLGPGLPGIPGFGYKRFQTFSEDGPGDLEAGLRYQYLRTADWQLAFTGGVRFPTGRVDDPDDLADVGFGAGAYALLFQLQNDWVISNLWQPKERPRDAVLAILRPGTLVLNGTVRYDLYLPDTQELRLLRSTNEPITADKANVDRDLGDVMELEVSARYTLLAGLRLSGLYKYGFRFKHEVTGPDGARLKALEDETDYTEHVVIAGVSYSTLPLYVAKRFPLPITASLTYRNRFAGSNNANKAQYIGLAIELLF